MEKIAGLFAVLALLVGLFSCATPLVTAQNSPSKIPPSQNIDIQSRRYYDTHVNLARQRIVEKDWEPTQAMDTIEAYRTFMNRHPESQYNQFTNMAMERINTKLWEMARNADNINIIAPDPSLPEEIWALSGRWEGEIKPTRVVYSKGGRDVIIETEYYGDPQKIILIVQEINSKEAQVIFSEEWRRDPFPPFLIPQTTKWFKEEYRVAFEDVPFPKGKEITLQGLHGKFSLKRDNPNILNVRGTWGGKLKKVR